jgi:hypothetical protein
VDLAEVERLVREGALERVAPDPAWARRMLDQGRLNARSAHKLLTDEEPNVVGAVVLAEAGQVEAWLEDVTELADLLEVALRRASAL